eukprot:gnl/MRDRNA2_/MRDRNA2_69410_c0_seq1.p1 gnl/MRDRNA2_/MRDRNA2_69410_c0~~gnl/MRDRNA2_/MRDRNA2_69410_c0_seq1.p1  ORF type:complete len:761 (-),score=77.69 gnl/MRDRNA2_/MRDRNA2_69410_c0_seq1:155-2437(-)
MAPVTDLNEPEPENYMTDARPSFHSISSDGTHRTRSFNTTTVQHQVTNLNASMESGESALMPSRPRRSFRAEQPPPFLSGETVEPPGGFVGRFNRPSRRNRMYNIQRSTPMVFTLEENASGNPKRIHVQSFGSNTNTNTPRDGEDARNPSFVGAGEDGRSSWISLNSESSVGSMASSVTSCGSERSSFVSVGRGSFDRGASFERPGTEGEHGRAGGGSFERPMGGSFDRPLNSPGGGGRMSFSSATGSQPSFTSLHAVPEDSEFQHQLNRRVPQGAMTPPTPLIVPGTRMDLQEPSDYQYQNTEPPQPVTQDSNLDYSTLNISGVQHDPIINDDALIPSGRSSFRGNPTRPPGLPQRFPSFGRGDGRRFRASSGDPSSRNDTGMEMNLGDDQYMGDGHHRSDFGSFDRSPPLGERLTFTSARSVNSEGDFDGAFDFPSRANSAHRLLSPHSDQSSASLFERDNSPLPSPGPGSVLNLTNAARRAAAATVDAALPHGTDEQATTGQAIPSEENDSGNFSPLVSRDSSKNSSSDPLRKSTKEVQLEEMPRRMPSLDRSLLAQEPSPPQTQKSTKTESVNRPAGLPQAEPDAEPKGKPDPSENDQESRGQVPIVLPISGGRPTSFDHPTPPKAPAGVERISWSGVMPESASVNCRVESIAGQKRSSRSTGPGRWKMFGKKPSDPGANYAAEDQAKEEPATPTDAFMDSKNPSFVSGTSAGGRSSSSFSLRIKGPKHWLSGGFGAAARKLRDGMRSSSVSAAHS